MEKNLFKLLTLAAAALTLFCACEKTEPENPDDPGQTEKPFEAFLMKKSVEFNYGGNAAIDFSYRCNKGSVDIWAEPQDDTVLFDIAATPQKNGTITVSGGFDIETDRTYSIVFADGTDTLRKEVAVRMHYVHNVEPPVLNVEDKQTERILWPGDVLKTVVLNWSVTGGPADGMTVTVPQGVKATVYSAEDNMSGTVEVYSEGDATFKTADMIVTASNAGGSDADTVKITRAYVDVRTEDLTVSCTAGIYFIDVDASVPYEVRCMPACDYVALEKTDDGRVRVDVKETTLYWPRETSIGFRDTENFFQPVYVPFKQKGLPTSIETDRIALTAWWYAMNGPNWEHLQVIFPEDPSQEYDSNNWGTDAPLEKWGGFHFNVDGRVGDFRPRRVGHTGQIPPEIGMLDRLWNLDLSGCNIYGTLPDEMQHLKRLQFLDLAGNKVTETLDCPAIKSIVHNPDFVYLAIQGNLFTGGIPEWFADNTEFLPELRNNHLSGQVPDKVANSRVWKHVCDRWPSIDFCEYNLRQADNYALWVGEKPADVIRVGDHWEWKPGTCPYEVLPGDENY